MRRATQVLGLVLIVTLIANAGDDAPAEARTADQAWRAYERDVDNAIAEVQQHLADRRTEFTFEVMAIQAAAIEADDDERADAARDYLSQDENVIRVEPRRSLWKSEDGFFERLHEGHWIEKTPSGDAHVFDESARTADYVEISRTDGGAICRLYDDRCEFRLLPRDRAFRHHSDGGWE